MAHRKSKPSDPVTKYGRPIAYDREILIAICRRLIIGEELRKICTERGMPIGPVFLGWVQDHKEAREIYRSADNFHSNRRLAKAEVYRLVSVSEWRNKFVPISSAAGERTGSTENTSRRIGAKCTP